ncbi:Putative cell wall binding repeat-containing protein [Lachnospiraceae bacterium KH1T2]|nr:Putative cell wall binding repeat-containing protein [Lachnospiraceae bacterium KH1T2]
MNTQCTKKKMMKRRVNAALALVLAASMVAGPQVFAAEGEVPVYHVRDPKAQSENEKDEGLLADEKDAVYESITRSECIEMRPFGAGSYLFEVKVEDVNNYLMAYRDATLSLNGKKNFSYGIVSIDYGNKIVYIEVSGFDLRGGKNILEVRVGNYSVSYEGERVKYFNEEPEIDYSTGDIHLKFDCDEETKEQYKKMITYVYLYGSNSRYRVKTYDTDDGIFIPRSDVDSLDGDYKYNIEHFTQYWLKDVYTIDYDFYGTLLSKSSYKYKLDENGNCLITLTPKCYSELAKRSNDIDVVANIEHTSAKPILNDEDKTISFLITEDFLRGFEKRIDIYLGKDSLHFMIEPEEEKPSTIKLVHAWGRDIALDEEGNRISGFVEVDGNKYYTNDKGEVYKNKTILIDGKYYGFDAKGVIRSAGFVNGRDKLYYYDENGVRVTDTLFEVNGKKYYADENGVLAVNKTVEIDGVKYRFGKDGAMVEK